MMENFTGGFLAAIGFIGKFAFVAGRRFDSVSAVMITRYRGESVIDTNRNAPYVMRFNDKLTVTTDAGAAVQSL
jgi:hypothetical protein